MSDKEYAVTFKVQNNFLLKRMREAGYASGAQLARAVGIAQIEVSKLLNFKEPALLKNETWRKSVAAIADHLRCMPEDLIPEKHLRSAMKQNIINAEMSVEEVAQLASRDLPTLCASPEVELFRAEAVRCLEGELHKLTARQERILRLRYGLDGKEPKTFGEIGDLIGVTSHRVLQIHNMAIRYLKHPNRRNLLIGPNDLAAMEE